MGMTEEKRREMTRSNYAAQMEMLGYDSSGNPLDMVPLTKEERRDLETLRKIKSGEVLKSVCHDYAIYNGDWYRKNIWNWPGKAQEPRVMSLEEVNAADYCWLETKGWVDGDSFVPVLRLPNDYSEVEIGFSDAKECDYGCEIINYNKCWRCWTTRPSDAQREAVPWQ